MDWSHDLVPCIEYFKHSRNFFNVDINLLLCLHDEQIDSFVKKEKEFV